MYRSDLNTCTIVPYSYSVMGNVGSICMTVINFTLSLVKCFHGICLSTQNNLVPFISRFG